MNILRVFGEHYICDVKIDLMRFRSLLFLITPMIRQLFLEF